MPVKIEPQFHEIRGQTSRMKLIHPNRTVMVESAKPIPIPAMRSKKNTTKPRNPRVRHPKRENPRGLPRISGGTDFFSIGITQSAKLGNNRLYVHEYVSCPSIAALYRSGDWNRCMDNPNYQYVPPQTPAGSAPVSSAPSGSAMNIVPQFDLAYSTYTRETFVEY